MSGRRQTARSDGMDVVFNTPEVLGMRSRQLAMFGQKLVHTLSVSLVFLFARKCTALSLLISSLL